jgi:hypothetical protein
LIEARAGASFWGNPPKKRTIEQVMRMSRRRGAGIVPAIGWTLPVFVLATGLSAARADELADLRANQELLQRRVDQLAQVPPPAPPPGPGGPVLAGSFPRSFVIPGTEVSLRIGGQGVGTMMWWLKGHAPGGALGGQGGINEIYMDGQGGTGNLPSIPLNTHTFSNTCQTAWNRDPGSASNRDPSVVSVQACPGSEREGPARSGATVTSPA